MNKFVSKDILCLHQLSSKNELRSKTVLQDGLSRILFFYLLNPPVTLHRKVYVLYFIVTYSDNFIVSYDKCATYQSHALNRSDFP